MMKTVLKTTLAAGVAVALAGCASNGALQSQVDQATNKAEAAQSAAAQAQQTANQAMRTAKQAQSTAHANSERMERMFQSSQRK